MRILFIHSHYESLAIEYISAVLKKSGYDVSLLFEPALFHNFFLNRKSLHRPFSFLNNIVDKAVKEKPDIVAFSVIADNYQWTLELSRQIRKRINTVIVFGGVHPTSVPEYVLNDKGADYIVLGEGEYAFLDLVNAIKQGRDASNIKNIGGYRNGKPFINDLREVIADLDTLPFPDKDLFFNECKVMVRNSYMVMGSRGCNNSCSYCWNSAINRVYPGNKYFRRRSVENVINELLWAKQRYQIRKVTFYDEVFTSDKSWLKEFLRFYKEKIDKPFFCCVHPDDVDEEIVDLLSDAGCGALNIGIQTANEETRVRILNRRGSNQQIINALGLLRKKKIFVYSNVILGLPLETENDLIGTLKFCNDHKSDLPSIYWLRYYPGTRIVDIARQNSVLSEEQVEKINQSKDYSPYAISGSTYQKDVARIGNLILLSGVIPRPIINFLIKHKLYRFVFAFNLLFPAILFISWIKKIVEGKRTPFHYLNLTDYLYFYAFYINKKIRCSLYR